MQWNENQYASELIINRKIKTILTSWTKICKEIEFCSYDFCLHWLIQKDMWSCIEIFLSTVFIEMCDTLRMNPTCSIVSILTTYSCNATIIFLFIYRLNNPLWAFDLLFVGNSNYSSFYFEWFYISRHLFTTVSYVDFIEIWYQFCSKLFTAFKIRCMFKMRVNRCKPFCHVQAELKKEYSICMIKYR